MKTLCLTCSKQRITSKSVILLILWHAMMFVHINSMQCIGATVFKNSNISRYGVFGIGVCLIYLSFPLFGLLADVKIGKYNYHYYCILLIFVMDNWWLGNYC